MEAAIASKPKLAAAFAKVALAKATLNRAKARKWLDGQDMPKDLTDRFAEASAILEFNLHARLLGRGNRYAPDGGDGYWSVLAETPFAWQGADQKPGRRSLRSNM